jgi:hypothetical protein
LYAALPARLRNWRLRNWWLRNWRLRVGATGMPVVAVALGGLALLPSLHGVGAVLQLPQPSGQAQAQAWFDRAVHTAAGEHEMRDATPPLRIAAEGYTIYLDPAQYEITYLATVTEEGTPEAYRAQGYDVVLLGSGMYSRFYANPDVFAREVRIYDAFFALPEQMRFQGPANPLSFVGGGARVHVVCLTPRGVAFIRAVEGEQD